MRRRRNRLIVVGSIAVALLASISPAAGDQVLPITSEASVVGTDLDAEEYARDFGVTVAVAKDRFATMDRARKLQSLLREVRSEAFGGLWIDHKPFAVVVNVLTGKESTILPLVAELELTDETRIVTTDFSERELQRDLDAVPTQVPLGIEYATDIDIPTGRVEVRVPTAEDVDTLKEADFGPSVVVLVEDRVRLPADIIGGLALSNGCTSGFTVNSTSGSTRGISTAGHCTNTVVYGSTDLPLQDDQHSGGVDAQWHFTPNIEDPNQIRVNPDGTRRDITSRRARSEMMIGDIVCKYGRTTEYDCGTVRLLTDQGCVSNTNNTFIYVTNNGGDMADGGDSGGPVFRNNRAWGIVSCQVTNPVGGDVGDMVFMAQDRFSAIGAEVNVT